MVVITDTLHNLQGFIAFLSYFVDGDVDKPVHWYGIHKTFGSFNVEFAP